MPAAAPGAGAGVAVSRPKSSSHIVQPVIANPTKLCAWF